VEDHRATDGETADGAKDHYLYQPRPNMQSGGKQGSQSEQYPNQIQPQWRAHKDKTIVIPQPKWQQDRSRPNQRHYNHRHWTAKCRRASEKHN